VVLAVTSIHPFQFFPDGKQQNMRRALSALSSRLPIRDVMILEDKFSNEEMSVHTKKSNHNTPINLRKPITSFSTSYG